MIVFTSIELMFSSPARILSFIMFVAVFFAVSGIVSTAHALIGDDAAEICCDIEKKDRSGSSAPCSTPECNCISCLSAIVVPVIQHIVQPVSIGPCYQMSLLHLHASDYISTIEYPPEIV